VIDLEIGYTAKVGAVLGHALSSISMRAESSLSKGEPTSVSVI
jgi:hypothetical protein